jgi:hypothetical protein
MKISGQPLYPLKRRLGNPWRQSGYFGEHYHLLHLLGFEPLFLGSPVPSIVKNYKKAPTNVWCPIVKLFIANFVKKFLVQS